MRNEENIYMFELITDMEYISLALNCQNIRID